MIKKEWVLQEVKLYLLMPEVFNEFWEVFQYGLTHKVNISKGVADLKVSSKKEIEKV